MSSETQEDVWRRESPHVLAALTRRYGRIADCEDALQEALLEASRRWTRDGIPESPRGWLLRVASRRLIDARRQESARTDRERRIALLEMVDEETPLVEDEDATLEVLALCCHPALTPESQVTLALRVVLGLSTAQIASVLLIPSSAAGQRISRAKARIDEADRELPRPASRTERLPAMLQALYLLYTAGHSRSVGDELLDVPVTTEAIRLARLLHAAVPEESETAGLLALMLLSEARRQARTTAEGELVPLQEQDRGLWDRSAIVEGTALIEVALPVGPVGAYQLQAAISGVHAEAISWEQTDWTQIAVLYAMLSQVAPSPTVTMNRAVALWEAEGPTGALELLEPLLADARMARNHRLHAVRAPILESEGRLEEALESYRRAARLCASIPEQRFLNSRISRLETFLHGVGGGSPS